MAISPPRIVMLSKAIKLLFITWFLQIIHSFIGKSEYVAVKIMSLINHSDPNKINKFN